MNETLYIDNLKEMLYKTGEIYNNKVAYKIKINKDLNNECNTKTNGDKNESTYNSGNGNDKDNSNRNMNVSLNGTNNNYIEITHKQVRNMINSLGTALISLGLKDKRIAVIGENRYEWEIAYLATCCGTGVIVPLDKLLPEKELESLIERSDVEAIFFSGKYEEVLKKIKDNPSNKLKYLISMDRSSKENDIYSEQELIEKGNKLISNGDKSFIDAKVDNEKMSIMLFTSGTTSKSKVVALSHKNICSNLMAMDKSLNVTSDDTFLSVLPVHHVFECTVGFLFSLYKGATTVFCSGLVHIIDNLNEYHATIMACVPGIYERMFEIIRKRLEKQGRLDEILRKEEELKGESMQVKKEAFKDIHNMLGGKVKLFISGAAALDAKIEERYRLLGINLVQGYGLTETSPVVAVGTDSAYKTGSIGKTLPSVEAKLVDVNKDGIGELVVKGPNVALGYYNDEIATKESFKDGWFYTGDLAKIDNEGFIFICGRKKSVIVLKNGKNIFPEEMESIINKIDGVRESFIFGKEQSDDKNDIKINVKIVYDEEIMNDKYGAKTEEEIRKVFAKAIKDVNKSIPRYKAIRGFILTKKPLIKTTTNKIKRQDNLDEINQFEY